MPRISGFLLGISNMYLVQDKGTIIVDTGLEKTRGKHLEAFSGEMRLPFLAADESRLFESYGKLLGMAEVFYGGHGTPLLKKEMLELIRKDKSPDAENCWKNLTGEVVEGKQGWERF